MTKLIAVLIVLAAMAMPVAAQVTHQPDSHIATWTVDEDGVIQVGSPAHGSVQVYARAEAECHSTPSNGLVTHIIPQRYQNGYAIGFDNCLYALA